MKVKFRDIANFVAGQSPKSEYYSESEGIPFLQGNRTFGTFYPAIDTYTTKVTKIAQKGDILMSVRAPVGDLNFAPVDLCLGRGLASITAKNGDNAFLFYALKYNINNLLKQSNGTTYDSVTGDIVKDMDMIIPEDETTCKKISNLLYGIDSKIENNNGIISELESMSKTIYDYWFLQYEFPNEDGKPYKSNGGKMVYNKELKKEIPEGWTVENLSKLALFNNGINYDKDEIGDKEYKIINVRNITSSSLIINEAELDNIKLKKVQGEKYLVESNDILIARSGTPGAVRLLLSNPQDIIYCGFIIKCMPNNVEHRLLITYYLKMLEGSNATKTGGSIMQNVSQDTLKQVKICLPTEPIISAFNNKISTILNKIQNLIQENQELINLRDYLLPLLMNGQVSFKSLNN